MKRSGGVLMHISSLPGKYAIGTLGENAKKFIDFLSECNFGVWQVLPCGPCDEYNSPYSGKSAFAGNIYFIDPETLYKKNLLTKEDLKECECENIYFTSKKLYNYTIDEQSISHQCIKNYWDEIFVRNRLMEFTYSAIMGREYMNDKVKQLIQIDTVEILISNIECIIKERKFDKSRLRKLKNNDFYRKIVMKTNLFEINRRLGKKKTIAMMVFNTIVCFC